ncbi:MAG TPA: hypothetical protein VHH91_06430 [Vicinamibacterales bacterium]|jgi:hypothetical protein|nr:hypothetical protein [Vicinamibacterales bacterium]
MATFAVFVVATAPAGAARRAITGKLTKPGYTVIALAANGKAASVRGRLGGFRLRAPSDTVTLHLRDADGVYAGPVVIRGRGDRVVVGARAGARLGTLEVLGGYARPRRRVGRRSLDAQRWARARRGVPIGARNFGRVRSRRKHRAVPGDRDADGVPDRVDIDDDGDLVLDKLERRRRSRASQDTPRDPFDLASNLGAVPLSSTANVNAGSTDAQIDAALPEFGWLGMAVPKADSVELDCAGLTYCSLGGTGRTTNVARPEKFPECCDDDGDGHGKLRPTVVGPDFVGFHLAHGATSAQIGTGDTLILRLTNGGQETQLTDTQQFIFATVPALASYVDETGTRRTIAYPVGPGDPGAQPGNGLPAVDGPDADDDVEITVTLWRPQRRPTSEQECAQPPVQDCVATEWIDVGGLDYAAATKEGTERFEGSSGWCPQGALRSDDPSLRAEFGDSEGGGFRDLAPARPANPANTFTYTLNVTKCLTHFGLGFPHGATRGVRFQAFTPITGDGSAGEDNATSEVYFTRP